MKTLHIALAIGVTLLAIPAATLADTAMTAMKPVANGATIICRAVTAHEKSNAAFGDRALVCKTMDNLTTKGMMRVPDTKSDADKAWRDWLNTEIVIPPVYGGTG